MEICSLLKVKLAYMEVLIVNSLIYFPSLQIQHFNHPIKSEILYGGKKNQPTGKINSPCLLDKCSLKHLPTGKS